MIGLKIIAYKYKIYVPTVIFIIYKSAGYDCNEEELKVLINYEIYWCVIRSWYWLFDKYQTYMTNDLYEV